MPSYLKYLASKSKKKIIAKHYAIAMTDDTLVNYLYWGKYADKTGKHNINIGELVDYCWGAHLIASLVSLKNFLDILYFLNKSNR